MIDAQCHHEPKAPCGPRSVGAILLQLLVTQVVARWWPGNWGSRVLGYTSALTPGSQAVPPGSGHFLPPSGHRESLARWKC